MKVFVTGASGFIGSAVVPELLAAGHTVVGLARSEESARALAASGAQVQRGSLDDVDALRTAAAAADGIIHLAFIHDFANMAASVQTDVRAIETMGAALEGTGKPMVIASGLLGIAPGRPVLETDAAPPGWPRGKAEETMIALASRGVRTSILRLSPSVHGEHDHGFVAYLVGQARANGAAAYVNEGTSRWPAVHRLDAARLFRLALEKAPAGSRLHGVHDEGIPTREIAEMIGRRLGVPVVAKKQEEAGEYVGFLASFLAMDTPASSAATRQLLGWSPQRPGLLADLEANHYFAIT